MKESVLQGILAHYKDGEGHEQLRAKDMLEAYCKNVGISLEKLLGSYNKEPILKLYRYKNDAEYKLLCQCRFAILGSKLKNFDMYTVVDKRMCRLIEMPQELHPLLTAMYDHYVQEWRANQKFFMSAFIASANIYPNEDVEDTPTTPDRAYSLGVQMDINPFYNRIENE